MKKQNVRTLGLVVTTFTYLLVGAAIFDSIESEEEKHQDKALKLLEKQMVEKYKISQEDLKIMEEVVQLQQPFKAGKPWEFAGAFYYATTVLTTIGYGHSTPKTRWGKGFTMVYAMIGIPLGLVMFNSIGERLNALSSIVITKLRRALKAKQPETTEVDLILVVLTLSGCVTAVGALAFSHYEGWTYFQSIYYCFVTLTTIGFGDYVALQQDNSLETKLEYVAFALFFIMFGLAIIAASLNLMVLKFMTLNTEDEKRDEQQAIQAAAQNVRVEGDIIRQQNEVLNWQAEGAGSMQDIRSVCSCTCNSCNPFQQINRRLGQEDKESAYAYGCQRSDIGNEEDFSDEEFEDSHSDENGEEESKGRWVSTDTMRTPPCAGHDAAAAAGGQVTRQANKGKKNRSPDKTNRKRGKVFAKAESIHDIYRGQFLDVDGIELPSPLRAGVHLDNLVKSEWSELPTSIAGRERLTSSGSGAVVDQELVPQAGRIPTSPTTPTSLSHSAMPQSATSCVVVRDPTGGGFFTTLVSSAKKSVLRTDSQSSNPHNERNFQPGLNNEEEPNAIHLITMEKVSV